MAKNLVSGLIYVETTLRVEEFPIVHNPVNFPFLGVNSSVSGVGYNIARALGDEVNFLSLIGADSEGQLVQSALAADSIPAEGVLGSIPATPNWSFPPASWSAPSAATPFSRPSCTAMSNPATLV
jgi:acarbose 7IV-phosphotransferase